MVKLVNRAMMTTQTTGTGNVTLLAAVDGYHDFDTAGVGNGDVVPYTIEDGDQFEIGQGVYNNATKVLTRIVEQSSNNNAKINLSGDARVYVTVRASDIDDLQTQIDGKSASGHGHAISDTSGLQAALDGKATSAQGAKADSAVQPVSGHGLYPDADKTKLAGVATGATKNATDAQLRDRTTHTGAQPISTVTGLQTALNDKLDANAAAVSADKLTTPRSIALSGDVSGSASFDGSGNVTISATVANNSHTHTIANVGGLQSALDGKATSAQGAKADAAIPSAEKGALNGVATLDGTGKVPAAQLPSYVDDVEEYANFAAFPATGEDGKIYVDEAQGDIYRWSGSAYVQINDAVSSADQATKLATARAISLSGDVSGSVSFDGTQNVSINVTVADDSHNHTIANVDGLQGALDGKSGVGHGHSITDITGFSNSISPKFTNQYGYIQLGPQNGVWSHIYSDLPFYFNQQLHVNGDKVFHDGYHPNADKLTTARTISLTGDASGSVSFDGSSNVSINVTVADDSHNHTISNVDGLQGALDGKATSAQGTKADNALPASGGNVTGDIKLTSGAGLAFEYNSSLGSVLHPGGGLGYHNNDASIGAIKIRLPVAANVADMLSMWIDVFDYRSHETFSVYAAGYIYNNDTWINTTALILGALPDRDVPIRFGHDGTKACIWIGDTNDTWSYPQVSVRDVMVGYSSDVDAYKSGWSIEFQQTAFGTVSSTQTGNLPIASTAKKLEAARTISLSGDVSGSVSFDGSGNANIVTTVADDSHNHTIANVDGLQTALNGKLATGAKAADSDKLDGIDSSGFIRTAQASQTIDGGTSTTLNLLSNDNGESVLNLMGTGQGTGRLFVGQASQYGGGIEYNGDGTPVSTGAGSDNITLYRVSAGTKEWTAKNSQADNDWTFRGNLYANDGQRVFADNYHPNADKLTTGRTISLSGDASGSVSFDGSSNVSINVTVADDSHNHTIANVDGLQGALDGAVKSNGGNQTINGNLTLQGRVSNTNSELQPVEGFVALPKGKGSDGDGLEFRFDTSQTAYLHHADRFANFTLLKGSGVSIDNIKRLFTYTPYYINLNSHKDASNNFQFEVTGFYLSNSSNTFWRPYVLFHLNGGNAGTCKIELCAADQVSWFTAYDGPCKDVIAPRNYTTISPGGLSGMRVTFSGITGDSYLKMVGATSQTSPSFAWQMLKSGGDFYGDIRGKKDGNDTWSISHAGVISGGRFSGDGSTLSNIPISGVTNLQSTLDGLGNSWLLKSNAYTANAGDRVAANVTGGAWTLNLPYNPSAGDAVTVSVIDGDVTVNNLTINGNGKTIMGDSTLIYDVPLATVRLVYNGTEWRLA